MSEELKEKYCLLLVENSNGFFNELEAKAKIFGKLSVTLISQEEIMLEGDNLPMAELLIWILNNNLKIVKHLRPS
jgi:hypothetical protein